MDFQGQGGALGRLDPLREASWKLSLALREHAAPGLSTLRGW